MISAALTALVHILLHAQLFLWDDPQGMLLGPSACPFKMMAMLPPSWENERCQGVILSASVPFFRMTVPGWHFGATVECSNTCTLVHSKPFEWIRIEAVSFLRAS